MELDCIHSSQRTTLQPIYMNQPHKKGPRIFMTGALIEGWFILTGMCVGDSYIYKHHFCDQHNIYVTFQAETILL